MAFVFSHLCARSSLCAMRKRAAGVAGGAGQAAEQRPPKRAAATKATAAAAPAEAPDEQPSTCGRTLVLQYEGAVHATLVKRYKRFLGDVVFAAAKSASAGGEPAATTVIHVPNTGPMTNMIGHLPSEVLLSTSTSSKRKYAHTLEWIRPRPGDAWVGCHSAKANAFIKALLEQRLISELLPYERIQQEVKYGSDGKSKVDFVLHRLPAADADTEPAAAAAAAATAAAATAALATAAAAATPAAVEGVEGAAAGAGSKAASSKRSTGKKKASAGPSISSSINRGMMYVEVKSVTDHEDLEDGSGRIALFPDTPSERAQRHVRELTAMVRAGGAAACVFCIQREDCSSFAPNHAKDPAYGRLLVEAAEAGVQMVAVAVGLDAHAGAVHLVGPVPINLLYKYSG